MNFAVSPRPLEYQRMLSNRMFYMVWNPLGGQCSMLIAFPIFGGPSLVANNVLFLEEDLYCWCCSPCSVFCSLMSLFTKAFSRVLGKGSVLLREGSLLVKESSTKQVLTDFAPWPEGWLLKSLCLRPTSLKEDRE